MSHHDPATYWLNQIICENAQKLDDLPMVIAHQNFSHVYFTAASSVSPVDQERDVLMKGRHKRGALKLAAD